MAERLLVDEGRMRIKMGYLDAPHLDKKAIMRRIRGTPAYTHRARLFGDASPAVGRIYPLLWEEVMCDPLPRIPDSWKQAVGLDPGIRRTAAVWGALNPWTDVLYIFGEYYEGHTNTRMHANAIMSRDGPRYWRPVVSDPAIKGLRSEKDARKMLVTYRQCGMRITMADNSLDFGIGQVLDRFTTGRLKIYWTLTNFKNEFEKYRRDPDTKKVILGECHLLDALRYLVVSGLNLAKSKRDALPARYRGAGRHGGVADPVGGY